MQLQKELLLYLLGISFALVAIGIVWQNQNNRIKEVNSEITHWNVELKKIDKTVKKVDEAKAKKKRITHILKSIKILKKKQTDPAQLLDEINKNRREHKHKNMFYKQNADTQITKSASLYQDAKLSTYNI